MPKPGKLAAFLLTLGVPVPVSVAAVWPELVAHRPLLTTALLTFYEGALVGVAAAAASKAVRRRANQIADAVDQALGRRVSRYDRRYREYVRTAQRFVDAKGLATVGDHTPELDRIFVDVGLAPRPPQAVPGGVLSGVPPKIQHRHSIHDFLDHPERRVLVVLGVPGSGKTTLLHHVARHAADPDAREQRRRLPILLLLRDHSARITGNPQLSLPELLRDTLPDLRVKEPDGWWESQLHGGQCLILLDGLDEVADAEHRTAVTNWIENQIAIFPENDVVVTSRPHGYRTAAINAAQVLQIRPFTDRQVRKFLDGWYLAAERRTVGYSEQDVTARAQMRVTDLLDRLAKRPELYELAVSPLLLTMIVLVHEHRSTLPAGRADLYKEICEVMLWRRQEAKRLAARLPGGAQLRVLAHLAFTMMQLRTRDISAEHARQAIAPELARVSPSAAAADFLADMSFNGLLIEREHEVYAFAHHTIAEYLAAWHIRETGQTSMLVGKIDDSWWRETTLLYVSDADADSVVRACLDNGTIGALALAYDCEALTSNLAPDLRDRLQQVRDEAFSPTADPDRRRLVAGVLATSHLSRLVATGDGSRICPHPVTTDLYYLFCCDVPVPYPDGAPELVTDPPRPVAGVWYSDAMAFAQWINSVLSVDARAARYRLPTPDELEHVTSTRAAAALPLTESDAPVWTARATSRPPPTLWFPASRSDPRTVTGTHIRDTATQDAQQSPLLLHLSLMLAVTRARVLAHDHALALNENYNDARDPENTPDPDARRRANQLAGTRTTDLTLARELAHAIAHDLTETPAENLAQDLDRELDRAHQTASAIDAPQPIPGFPGIAAGDLTRTRDLVDSLDAALALARELDPDCTRFLDDHFSAADLRTIAVGPALAFAFADAQELRPTRSITFPAAAAALTARLMAAAMPDGYQAKLSLDRLDASLRTACTAFLRHPPAGATDHRERHWEVVVADRLRATAKPVFTRQRSVAAVPPITVQLPALVLAAKASDRGWSGPSKACREVAAGITLLARRANGEEPSEMLILART